MWGVAEISLLTFDVNVGADADGVGDGVACVQRCRIIRSISTPLVIEWS